MAQSAVAAVNDEAVLVLFTRQVSENYTARVREMLHVAGFSVKTQVSDTIESTMSIMHEEALKGVQFCIVLANKRHEENRTCNLNFLNRTNNRVKYHVRYRVAINRIWKESGNKRGGQVPFPEEETTSYEQRTSGVNTNNKRQQEDEGGNNVRRRYGQEDEQACYYRRQEQPPLQQEYDPFQPSFDLQAYAQQQQEEQRLNYLFTLLHQLQQQKPQQVEPEPVQHFIPTSLLNPQNTRMPPSYHQYQ